MDRKKSTREIHEMNEAMDRIRDRLFSPEQKARANELGKRLTAWYRHQQQQADADADMDSDDDSKSEEGGEKEEEEEKEDVEEPSEEELEEYRGYLKLRTIVLRRAIDNYIPGNSEEEDARFENRYLDLYDDLVEHEYGWFAIIFKDTEYLHDVQFVVAALIKLAGVHIWKGDMKHGLNSLAMLERAMRCWQKLVEEAQATEDYEIVGSYLHDQYKVHFNAAMELARDGKKEKAVQYFKKALDAEDTWEYYETHVRDLFFEMTGEDIPDNDIEIDNDDYIDFMYLHESDEKIWKCLQDVVKTEEPNNNPKGRKECGHCGIREKKNKKHMACSRCKSAFYCSKDCQVEAWKEHKRACKKGYIGAT